MNTIQCPHCNESVPYDNNKEKQFCSSCGGLLKSENAKDNVSETIHADQNQQSIGCLTVIGTLCLALAIIIIAILGAFFELRDREPLTSFSLKLAACGVIILIIGRFLDAVKK